LQPGANLPLSLHLKHTQSRWCYLPTSLHLFNTLLFSSSIIANELELGSQMPRTRKFIFDPKWRAGCENVFYLSCQYAFQWQEHPRKLETRVRPLFLNISLFHYCYTKGTESNKHSPPRLTNTNTHKKLPTTDHPRLYLMYIIINKNNNVQ
jgi:hypothetical protein